MNNRIYLSPPHMGGEEQVLVQEAFDTNWIAPVGPHLTAFEEELGAYNGIPHVVALSSGTAAIHLALKLVGVTEGNVVFCQSFTFGGSAFPILYEKAIPYFIDSENDTWNMSPELLEAAIQNTLKLGLRPAAIVVVHLYGMPAKIEEIRAVAQHYHIPVVEDAAEGLGSTFRNQKLGTFGDVGVYSFNGNKIITTGGGGALVSQRHDWVEKARFWATQAREKEVHYEHKEVGFNYRMGNVPAAIGRGQLNVLDERVKRKREIFEQYTMELSGYIDFQPERTGAFSNRWLATGVLKESAQVEKVIRALEEQNIESRPLWKPMHLQPVFQDSLVEENGCSEKLFEQGICLPSGTALSETEQEKIIAVVKRVLSG